MKDTLRHYVPTTTYLNRYSNVVATPGVRTPIFIDGNVERTSFIYNPFKYQTEMGDNSFLKYFIQHFQLYIKCNLKRNSLNKYIEFLNNFSIKQYTLELYKEYYLLNDLDLFKMNDKHLGQTYNPRNRSFNNEFIFLRHTDINEYVIHKFLDMIFTYLISSPIERHVNIYDLICDIAIMENNELFFEIYRLEKFSYSNIKNCYQEYKDKINNSIKHIDVNVDLFN